MNGLTYSQPRWRRIDLENGFRKYVLNLTIPKVLQASLTLSLHLSATTNFKKWGAEKSGMFITFSTPLAAAPDPVSAAGCSP